MTPTMLARGTLGVALLGSLAGCSGPPGGARGPATAEDAVNPRTLEAHVRMLSETLAPRHWQRPDQLDRAAEYIAGRLREAGARLGEQVYDVEDAGRYRNVIGSFGPEVRERIVVGAHYDAFGPHPAADDNASGVAALLELARLLGAATAPAVRVDLVAFTLEEPPYYDTQWMGSWVHAAALRREGVAVRAMLSLEMLGYFDDAPGSQRFPLPLLRLFYPSTGNFIAVIGRLGQAGLVRRIKGAMREATDLDVQSMSAPTWIPGIDFSDHRSFWANDYPAVMVTYTAFYRNDRYHTARDTPDTLDYPRMARVVRAVHHAVLNLAR